MTQASVWLLAIFCPFFCALVLGINFFKKNPWTEKTVSIFVTVNFGFFLLFSFVGAFYWVFLGCKPVFHRLGFLYHQRDFHFSVEFYIDHVSILFLTLIAILSNIIAFYAQKYLHKEQGYIRFFAILSFFTFSMALMVCAGSFNWIFAAWEMAGISSFLLIGFYFRRPKAAIHAFRVFVVYRICDVGLLAAVWLSHVIWHEKAVFPLFEHKDWQFLWGQVPLVQQYAIAFCLLVAVLGKSAQFPFFDWLIRAMEGPTPSSAIFYGSLSVHAGVFLLLRTYPIWHSLPGMVFLVGFIGLITAVFCTLFSQVQANIKGQIGYASIAQVGLMLVELSFGFVGLALFHLVGNAFLRCFQLLISSTILTRQLRIHSALEGQTLSKGWSLESILSKKLQSTLYVFSLNEGYVFDGFERFLMFPFLRLCELCGRYFYGWLMGLLTLGVLTGFFYLEISAYFCLLLAVFFSLCALGERGSIKTVAFLILFSHLSLVISFHVFMEEQNTVDLSIYLTGFFASFLMFYFLLDYVLKRRHVAHLDRFSGLMLQFPNASSLCFLGILGLTGFPLSGAFLGEDLMLYHAAHRGWTWILVVLLIHAFNSMTLMHLYVRVFWGKRQTEVQDLDLDLSKFASGLWFMFWLGLNMATFYMV